MQPRDTSPHVQRLMDEHYRRMTPAEKARTWIEAWEVARAFQLAGLRYEDPTASAEELEDRLAERRLGRELYLKARAARDAALRQ